MDKIYRKALSDTVLNTNITEKNNYGRHYIWRDEAHVYLFLSRRCEFPISKKYFPPVL